MDSRFKLDAIIRTDDLDRPGIIQSIDLSVNDEYDAIRSLLPASENAHLLR